ncbi:MULTISPECIES: EpsG family protein [Alistipes]|uniref:EpsG family protein n=1 Tax=Alistipes TaxID=239759 RepID=UPI001B3A43AA|nr:MULTISPECIES: EpsG family protein [Alistipes]MBQ4904490.1 EpsG family protein [Alistipes sp. Marseille-P2263]MCI2259772.1 EpsG family protein [Alistipes dispar]
MFFVLIFFTINILFCIWNPSYKNRQIQTIYWAFCVLAIFFIGFRGAIDNDYAAYTAMFADNSILVEPAFLLIRFLIRDICGGGITGLMFVYAIISVTIKFVAIKRYSEFIFPSLIIWIGNLMILQDMTQIRAAAACGILLLSIGALYHRNWLHYFGWVLLATMFHASALLMLPLWFLSSDRINRGIWTCVILTGYLLSLNGIYLTSLISFVPIEFIQEKFLIYSVEITDDGNGGANILGLFQITRIGIFLFLLWNIHKIQPHNRYSVLLLKIMACGLTALPLFRNNLTAGLRITEFLTCVDILLFPMVIYLFSPKALGKWLVVGYSAAIMYGRLFVEELLK